MVLIFGNSVGTFLYNMGLTSIKTYHSRVRFMDSWRCLKTDSFCSLLKSSFMVHNPKDTLFSFFPRFHSLLCYPLVFSKNQYFLSTGFRLNLDLCIEETHVLTRHIDLRMRNRSSLFAEIVGIFHRHNCKLKNFARPKVKSGLYEMENI